MQIRSSTLSVATAAIVLAACGGGDTTTTPPTSKIVNFSVALKPSGEPVALNGNTSASTGTFTATLDTSTNVFTWNAQFSGLSSNVTAGHIHGPFPSGAATSANVILNFASASLPGAVFTGLNAANSGAATGTVTLNSALTLTPTINGDSLRKLLLAGLTYANIHTSQNGGGEIRAQILITPPGT